MGLVQPINVSFPTWGQNLMPILTRRWAFAILSLGPTKKKLSWKQFNRAFQVPLSFFVSVTWKKMSDDTYTILYTECMPHSSIIRNASWTIYRSTSTKLTFSFFLLRLYWTSLLFNVDIDIDILWILAKKIQNDLLSESTVKVTFDSLLLRYVAG